MEMKKMQEIKSIKIKTNYSDCTQTVRKATTRETENLLKWVKEEEYLKNMNIFEEGRGMGHFPYCGYSIIYDKEKSEIILSSSEEKPFSADLNSIKKKVFIKTTQCRDNDEKEVLISDLELLRDDIEKMIASIRIESLKSFYRR